MKFCAKNLPTSVVTFDSVRSAEILAYVIVDRAARFKRKVTIRVLNNQPASALAALHQGSPGQMTWLEDPPPWLKRWLRPA